MRVVGRLLIGFSLRIAASDMLLASLSLAIACGLVLVRLIASLRVEKRAGAMRDARLDASFLVYSATHGDKTA